MAASCPATVSPWVWKRIEASANFMRPFIVPPALVHIEFFNNSVGDSTDNSKKLKNLTWVPANSYSRMRNADCIFPSVFNWTSPIIARSTTRGELIPQGALKHYYDELYLLANMPITTPQQSIAAPTAPNTSKVDTTTSPPTTPIRDQGPSRLKWGDILGNAVGGPMRSFMTVSAIKIPYITSALTNVFGGATWWSGDTRRVVTNRLGGLIPVCMCSKFKLEPNCTSKASDSLVAWATTYQHSGIPEEEYLLLPWLQCYDMMRPILYKTMTASFINMMDDYTLQFIVKGDTAFSTPRSPDKTFTYRLYIRATAAVILNDPDLIASTQALNDAHAALNLFSDGKSWDYLAHDSLEYHTIILDHRILHSTFGMRSHEHMTAAARFPPLDFHPKGSCLF
jgi:hypothetical protein